MSNRIAVVLLICVAALPMSAQDLFDYPNGSQPEYDSYSMRSVYVTLSDSTQIATDIYLPTGGPPRTSFPVVFQFTAYNRAILVPRFGPVKWLGAKLIGFGTGPVFDMSEIEPNMAFLMEHGYAMVVADLRGTGASSGSQLPLMPRLGEDGKEMVDWIASQPWCDGNVGMMGPSYLGWIQYMTAANQPEALKCIMPEVMGFDIYTAAFRPGGILATRWINAFDHVLQRLNRNWYDLGGNALPSLPVMDEDGDGDLTDEWPEMDSLSQEERRAPEYRDGKQRLQNRYYEYSLEHLDNVLVRELKADTFRFADAGGPDGYEEIGFAEVSPWKYLPAVKESGIPLYLVAGWFDGFGKGPFRYFASLGDEYPAWLFAAPRFHIGNVPGYYRREFGYEGKYVEQLGIEQLRFFDRFLKGLDNGFDTRPPVTLYTAYQGWQQAADWPLPAEEQRPFYFSPGGKMTASIPSAAVDTYEVDFSVASNYGRNDLNRWMMTTTGPGTVMERSEIDERCQVYETEQLSEGMEITGHPVVHLWLAADQPAGDVFVYLEDVAPDGKALYMTEGQLRSGFRRLVPDDEMVGNAFDVRPDLPWHGFRRQDWIEPSLSQGEPVELVLDLMPVSWWIRPGHRIRISFAGADQGNFELNPALCPDGDPATCESTRYFFSLGSAFPSRVILPVISHNQSFE